MKTPKPVKLPSGSWNIRMRLGGENVSVTRLTKTECIHAAEEIKGRYKNGKWEKEEKAEEKTLDQMIDDYVNSRRKTLSPSTIGGYTSIKKNAFQDFLKKKPSEIKCWQDLIDNEIKKGRNAKTVRNRWSLLESALKYSNVSVPYVSLPQIVKSTRPWLDDEQIRKFCESIRGNEYEIPMLLCLHSLRRSEVFGLEWSQIDLANNIIHIEGSVVQGEKGKLVQREENKTTESKRDVPIMHPRLKELLEAVPKKDRKGKIYTKPRNYLWREINRVCKENDLPLVGNHGLRHSYASIAVHVGLNPHEAAIIGGWKDIHTMQRIYTHISDSDLLKAQNKIAQFFSDQNGIQNADENSESQANKAL